MNKIGLFGFKLLPLFFVNLTEEMAATQLFDNHGRPINYCGWP